ncbi:MAG: AAA family ATPase [Deferribacteraceae bacterium]|jgi:aminoglycoside phosphotransferase family enzyme/predicted kinase|nr:AAA family ATPase [Deferribacteraceae bacterium]
MRPIDILKGIIGEGAVVETHCSQVLITKKFVYKIKRPVYFGFLDYRELKQRRACSVMEVELNNRFSKDVYLGVFKIVQREDKYALVELDNSLPAVEYVVKMRKIENYAFLTNILNQKYCNQNYLRGIGILLARRLSMAENAPAEVDGMDPYELVRFNTLENFDQLREIAPDMLDKRFRFVENITRRFLKENKDLFYLRHKSGFVKNGHGDLRLEHIFVEGLFGKSKGLVDGKDLEKVFSNFLDEVPPDITKLDSEYLVLDNSRGVSMIDCIEFNRRFRTNDLLSEAAFLTMEMDQLGKHRFMPDCLMLGFFDYLSSINVDDKLKDFSLGRVVSIKNKDTGEIYYRTDKLSEESYSLLNFYRCYRAMVRAKVALLAYQNTEDEETKKIKLKEYNTLLDLAFAYSIAMLKICGIAFCGMLATGKSTHAARFAERFCFGRFDSDRIRKVFAGNIAVSTVVPTGEGIYNEETSLQVYSIMGNTGKTSVSVGRAAVFDATFLNKKCLQRFETNFGSVPIYIKFTSDESVIKERLAARSGGLSDGRLMHFDDLYPLSKELPADFEIDTTPGVLSDPIETIVDKLIELLDVNIEAEL